MQPFEVIANVLFVEAGLQPARRVTVHGPEAGRIGREHFVNQNHLVLAHPELEFGVGDDEAALGRETDGLGVETKADVPDGLGAIAPDHRGHALKRDVFVVLALRGFGSGRENRGGQLVGFAQSGRQRDAAHCAGL